MRNKELVEKKLERVEAQVKLIGYHLHRSELTTAYDLVAVVTERIQEIYTLLNTETQK